MLMLLLLMMMTVLSNYGARALSRRWSCFSITTCALVIPPLTPTTTGRRPVQRAAGEEEEEEEEEENLGFFIKPSFNAQHNSSSHYWSSTTSYKKKKSTRQPDFQHKMAFECAWIDSWLNSPWLKENFATMSIDPVESSARTTTSRSCRVHASGANYDKIQKLTCRGRLSEALDLLEFMARKTSATPQGVFGSLVRACTKRKALPEGKQVHALIVKTKRQTNMILSNLLIDMYSACGSVTDALKVFTFMPQRNVFSWTAMISAYAKSAQCKEAATLFWQMCEAGIEPDEVACVVALKACTNIAALEEGQQIHSIILKKGFDSNVVIQTTLVDMYAKCGCLKDARELFDNMAKRDVISWNAMIAAYAQKGLGKEALDLYVQMKDEGMVPDNVTLVLLLKACASISALKEGKQLHCLILEKGLESDITIQNTLVDMYAKCGCLKDARKLFDNMTERNVISWNSMIAAYAQEGLGNEALDLFEQMKDEGLQADEITLTCILSACSHSGLVDKGRHVFENMSKGHVVTPTLEQYACMADLLGRAGCLADAEDLVLKMPFQPDTMVWTSLLVSARKHCNVEIGRRAFERIVELEPENAASYLLLIDIYSAAGRMDEVAEVRKEMNDKGLKTG